MAPRGLVAPQTKNAHESCCTASKLLSFEIGDHYSDSAPTTNSDLASCINTQIQHIMTTSGSRIGLQITSMVLLFILLFGLTATCPHEKVIHQLQNRIPLITGLCLQFLLMPFLGFVAVKSFEGFISPAIGFTLLVVTSSPGGGLSNLWSSLFNADLPLSVAMTTMSSLLGIFTLPANLYLYTIASYGSSSSVMKSIKWKGIFLNVVIIVVAVMFGLAASYRFRTEKVRQMFKRIGSLSGLAMVIVSIIISREQKTGQKWNRPWVFYLAVALPCLLGFFLATLAGMFARLKRPELMAVTIECCNQNVAIGLSVAMTAFADESMRSTALSVPMFYGVVQAVTTAIFGLGSWKAGWSKAPENEKLCVVLRKNYEVYIARESDNDDGHTGVKAEEHAEGSDIDGNIAGVSKSSTLDMDDDTEESADSSRPGCVGDPINLV